MSFTFTPVYIIELSFDDANTDVYYLTSHANVATPNEAITFQNCLMDVGYQSQTLDFFNFNSTVGNIKFKLLDNDGKGTSGAFSALLREKDLGPPAKSLRKKRVRIYESREGLPWSAAVMRQTQQVKNFKTSHKHYEVNCNDVQRYIKSKLFEPAAAHLRADIGTIDTTITLSTTEGFYLVEHHAGFTHLPSQEVGYLVLEDGNNKEIISYTVKEVDGVTLSGIERGLFGTSAIAIKWQDDSVPAKDRKIEINEHVHWEGSAVGFAYSILTGDIYGTGKSMPAHWTLGIDPQYIDTLEFTTIGAELWDTSDATKGQKIYFSGIPPTDGKAFVQSQLYALAGVFSPIRPDGELGLRKLTVALPGTHANAHLTNKDLQSISSITEALDQIINRFVIDWHWDGTRDKYRKRTAYLDKQSITKHKVTNLKVFSFWGLSADLHTEDIIRHMFEAYRSLFSGPPKLCDITLAPTQEAYEVGDVIHLKIDNMPDYNGVSTTLDRPFLVLQVSSGRNGTKLKLMGSSEKPVTLSDSEYGPGAILGQGPAIDDAYYTMEGVDMVATYPGNFSQPGGAGTTITMTSDLHVIGQDNLLSGGSLNPNAKHYFDGPAIIPVDRSLTWSKNIIWLGVGNISGIGTFSCDGGGYAGTDYRRYDSDINIPYGGFVEVDGKMVLVEGDEPSFTIDEAYPLATGGYVGGNFPGQAAFTASHMLGERYAIYPLISTERVPARTNLKHLPPINFDFSLPYADPSFLSGIPNSLMGAGGGAGGGIYKHDIANELIPLAAHGGNGGNGGGGGIIICRGLDFGPNDEGILSCNGADAPKPGEAGGPESVQPGDDLFYNYPGSGTAADTPSLRAGGGAGGGPGCIYIFIDGYLENVPPISSATIGAKWGKGGTPADGDNLLPVPDMSKEQFIGQFQSSTQGIAYIHDDEYPRNEFATTQPLAMANLGFENISLHDACVHVQILSPQSDAAPINDPTDTSGQVVADPPTDLEISDTAWNVPPTETQLYTSITLTVTPPEDANYSHARIEWKWATGSNSEWENSGLVANNEVVLVVPNYGVQINIRAVSVSVTDTVGTVGPSVDYTTAQARDGAAQWSKVSNDNGGLPENGANVTGNHQANGVLDDTISASSIQTNAVTAAAIADNSVTALAIQDSAVTALKIATNAVTAGKIAQNAVTSGCIDQNVVSAWEILDNTITAGQIAQNAVTAFAIQDSAVTALKIAANAVTANAIGVNAVESDAILVNAVTAGKIAQNAVTSGCIDQNVVSAWEILDNTITAGQIAQNAVTAFAIDDSSVSALAIQDSAVTALKIATNAVTAGKIAQNAVTSGCIDQNVVSAWEILDNTITAGQIAQNAITAFAIADNSVTALAIANNSVGALAIQSSAVNALHIENLSITAGEIAQLTIHTDKMIPNTLKRGTISDNATNPTSYTGLELESGKTYRDMTKNNAWTNINGMYSGYVGVDELLAGSKMLIMLHLNGNAYKSGVADANKHSKAVFIRVLGWQYEAAQSGSADYFSEQEIISWAFPSDTDELGQSVTIPFIMDLPHGAGNYTYVPQIYVATGGTDADIRLFAGRFYVVGMLR